MVKFLYKSFQCGLHNEETHLKRITGIRGSLTTKLEDLDFAEDVALIFSKFQDIEKTTHKSQVGLGIKINKTKDNETLNSKTTDSIMVDRQDNEGVNMFTYLEGGDNNHKEGAAKILKSEWKNLSHGLVRSEPFKIFPFIQKLLYLSVFCMEVKHGKQRNETKKDSRE